MTKHKPHLGISRPGWREAWQRRWIGSQSVHAPFSAFSRTMDFLASRLEGPGSVLDPRGAPRLWLLEHDECQPSHGRHRRSGRHVAKHGWRRRLFHRRHQQRRPGRERRALRRRQRRERRKRSRQRRSEQRRRRKLCRLFGSEQRRRGRKWGDGWKRGHVIDGAHGLGQPALAERSAVPRARGGSHGDRVRLCARVGRSRRAR